MCAWVQAALARVVHDFLAVQEVRTHAGCTTAIKQALADAQAEVR